MVMVAMVVFWPASAIPIFQIVMHASDLPCRNKALMRLSPRPTHPTMKMSLGFSTSA